MTDKREKKEKKNRVRKIPFQLYLTEEEKTLLDQKVTELGISRSDFIRDIIVNGEIRGKRFAMDKVDAKKLLAEVGKIGSNINQIAYNTNVKSYTNYTEIQEVKKLFFRLLKILGDLPYTDEYLMFYWQLQLFNCLPPEWAEELDVKKPDDIFDEEY